MNDSVDNNKGDGLTRQILIAMAAGICFGLLLYFAGTSTSIANSTVYQYIDQFILHGVIDIAGQIFISSLKVLVVPLVFVSLVCGVASLNEATSIGIISIKTLGLYLFTTAAAISIALLLATIVQPGIGVEVMEAEAFQAQNSPGLKAVLLNIFPVNIVDAMAKGSMLQIIIFAILFGAAIQRAGTDGESIMQFFRAMDKVIMRLVLIIMDLAPYGVFCLMAMMFATTGPDHVVKLAKYFATVISALLIHGTFVFSFLLVVFTRLNPFIFLKKVRSIWLFAFSTASSNATIPVTLNVVENKLGVSNKIASFTVPLGATINMDGTAIMQGVATVFIAQIYGIDIGITGYLTVITTATLASIGTAGVPGVGMIMLALVLEQVGLPVEGIALIIGIDRLLDMLRTAVNVTGDAVVTTIVAKSSNALDETVFNAKN